MITPMATVLKVAHRPAPNPLNQKAPRFRRGAFGASTGLAVDANTLIAWVKRAIFNHHGVPFLQQHLDL